MRGRPSFSDSTYRPRFQIHTVEISARLNATSG